MNFLRNQDNRGLKQHAPENISSRAAHSTHYFLLALSALIMVTAILAGITLIFSSGGGSFLPGLDKTLGLLLELGADRTRLSEEDALQLDVLLDEPDRLRSCRNNTPDCVAP